MSAAWFRDHSEQESTGIVRVGKKAKAGMMVMAVVVYGSGGSMAMRVTHAMK
jgi:hypothetical protein